MKPETALSALSELIDTMADLTIAVSGGVDSLTLATAMGRRRRGLLVVHSVSPAVPPDATERVRIHAGREGWTLREMDTGEFGDADYLRNPVNRCYFCKSNLYARIRSVTEGPVASGTNLDDLEDFRPGLTAAAEQGVIHPFVDVGMRKSDVRALAQHLGLPRIAKLPAQPCLSSRVETGIAIRRADLEFVNRVETLVRTVAGPGDVRCRITHDGVRLEFDGRETASLNDLVAAECAREDRPFLGIGRYRMGSAFLRTAT